MLWTPEYNPSSAWTNHIPFAFWLVDVFRPKTIVELGTHRGASYFSMCQAVKRLGFSTKCFAVDTWKGDCQAGYYSEEVYRDVAEWNDKHFSAFSRLVRSTFDEALQHFADASIDLLHIDGLHTYEAVRHDFDAWLPKLSDNAVVLFHDTNVHENNFGVFALWREVTKERLHFEFLHGHGLGVLGLGHDYPAPLKYLFNAGRDGALTYQIRDSFASLGRAASFQYDNGVLGLQVAELRRVISESDNKLADQTAVMQELERAKSGSQNSLADNLEKINQLENGMRERNNKLATQTIAIQELQNSLTEKLGKISHLENMAREKDAVISEFRRPTFLLKLAAAIRHPFSSKRRKMFRHVRVVSDEHVLLPRTDLKLKLRALWRYPLNSSRRKRYRSIELQMLSSTEGLDFDPHDPIESNPIIAARRKILLQDIALRFKAQNITTIEGGPLISIIVPVYKTPIDILRCMIESVERQNYSSWELCIVDDGSIDAEIETMLRAAAKRDSRIKIELSNENGGISSASNKAIELATGEYIALLDHDDELTSDALAEVGKAIDADPDCDIIYSDECRIMENGSLHEIFAKPDWSPLLMLACMYMGHLTVYRKSLVQALGGFRSEFDFSQDYDLALRATEKTVRIRHIPKILYGWRAIPRSAAAGSKGHARTSNIAALQDAVNRRGWSGRAEALPASNHIVWSSNVLDALVTIIIPSDNLSHIKSTLQSLITTTTYENWEAIVVTNSGLISTMSRENQLKHVRYAPYDEPFNFSRKCNVGARHARGKYLVFFNDDVRVLTIKWLEHLVEILDIEGTGAVSPKLLYENDTIQYAGMITGVRRLIGTAFHTLPAETHKYFNFAQSLREVSLLSGACLAVKAATFAEVGGFNEIETPIYHSDVDLCLKIRALNLSCVYTPYAMLRHFGHSSLRRTENKRVPKDKSTIYLLKQWPRQIANDPFFTKQMRELLYHDSAEYFELFPCSEQKQYTGKDILLVTHDLSESGAPRVIFEVAKILNELGHFVVVASPTDGKMRGDFQQIGVNVIVDELLLSHHQTVCEFARNFDLIIANTCVTWPVVHDLSSAVEIIWYIHEISLVSNLAASSPKFVASLNAAQNVWVGSKLAAEALKQFGCEAKVIEYGRPGLETVVKNIDPKADKRTICVFGSYEYRKGQDLLVDAVKTLDADLRAKISVQMYGRVLDAEYFSQLTEKCNNSPEIILGPEVSYVDYRELLSQSDLVVLPSRDDTLPLVSLDALSICVPVLCTSTTGIALYLRDNETGFIVKTATVSAIADKLQKILELPLREWENVGREGRVKVFNRHFSIEAFKRRLSQQLEHILRSRT